ncbi:MAG: diguanylate cyclase [Planctomycetes bacterium]|nr:diguanylate cyclase [Planctomycetota bacterium]
MTESRVELVNLRIRVDKLEESMSEFRRREVSTEEALRFAEGILDTVRDPLLVLSGDLRISSANRAFYDCFQATPENTLGKHLYALGNGQWDDQRLLLLLKEVIPGDLHIENFEMHNDFPVIGRRVMFLNARRFDRDNFGTQSILLSMEDVTERKLVEGDLMAAAVTDPLTGLQNRRGMSAQAGLLIEKSRGLGRGFDLICIDVDRLKTINDQFGHAEGDRAIVDVAFVLRAVFRQSEIIARVGGDEFVVAPAGEQGEDHEVILLRLNQAMEAHNLAVPRPFTLSLSAGIAGYDPATDKAIDDILAAGDAAMYEHKRRRRGD